MRYLKNFSKTFYNFEHDPVMKELKLSQFSYVLEYMQMVSTFFLSQLEALTMRKTYSPNNMMLVCETKYLNQVIFAFFKLGKFFSFEFDCLEVDQISVLSLKNSKHFL